MKSSNNKARMGVVGVGYLGRFHALKYAQIPDVELAGVVDVNQKRADEVAGECSTNSFYDYSQLFGLVEGVSIAAPTKDHFNIARDFLERNIDVLLEKPMTCSLTEADELIRIADKNGAILQIGHLERFNPAVIALKDTIDKPLFIESHRLAHFKDRGTDVDVILDLMIHDIDIILSLVKASAVNVEAVGVPVISENVDIANARLSFNSGCVANVTASRISSKDTRKIRIFQPNAYISIDYANQKIAFYKRVPGKKGFPCILSDDINLAKIDILYEEIKAFLHSVKTRNTPPVTGLDGKRALEVALKIQEEVSMWQEKAEGF